MNNFIFAILCGVLFSVTQVQCRSFTIDYDQNTFRKDGEPFFYLSGSYHYSRTHYNYWEDRMIKAKAAGLDAIQTYIPWNVHEPVSGQYDFSGQQNFTQFFSLAQKHGLLVVLRAGPYICGEWEFGGLPAWILKANGSVVVRTMDPGFIEYVDRWFKVLLPKVKPFLYNNGGPVIMVQIENEYGSYFACDRTYMAHLRDLARSLLGEDVILFTTDGSGLGFLKCGAVKGVYATVDFGPGNMTAGFAPMRQWNPKGPLVNSEYYTGWLDHWGSKHAHGDTHSIVSSLVDAMNMKASVNMYMFEGGTNFGYMNGADPTFAICPTSYDYDGPLTEAGDVTEKYLAIRQAMQQFKTIKEPVPPNTKKVAYGKVDMTMLSTVVDSLVDIAVDTYNKQYPLSMEQCNQNYGFILYRHKFTQNYPSSVLSVAGIRDRGYVMLDGHPVGLLDRNGVTSINTYGRRGQSLDIVVENQGRINFGSSIVGQSKGILGNVTFGGVNLTEWSMYPLNFSRIFDKPIDSTLRFSPRTQADSSLPLQPAIYTGSLDVGSEPADTYMSPVGWGKGQFFINGFNVGRYWPDMGPQVTLYVPKFFLRPGKNTVVLVELEAAPNPTSLTFTDTPVLNSTGLDFGSGRFRKVDALEWSLNVV